ncbi:FAD-dependent oxidoreductase [Spongiibacter sp. KMU-166]|uniref:FAD-dependent oxidoreductase n=1 Tax=Spongiibacter thalassae TaxID=2721624 RepID=A0ABX1GBC5_9GAMM|nr:FAD-dependent oxidoreductase [Spongiibacter thalassae]NKI16450.1 FAD-dependent oxidoreductase [Spongiibacter thalassae]
MMVKDVIVVGSGGAGMTAALVAARSGLDVLLLEKTEYFGGTTALSGGGIWVPCSPQAKAAGIEDSIAEAESYVTDVVGSALRRDLLDSFLHNAPEMVRFLDDNSEVKFTLQPGFADWHPGVRGFKDSGRLLSPLVFDGRTLGPWFQRLRPPLTEFNAPGGCMVGISDMPHIANARRSLRSFAHIVQLLLRFGLDRLRYARGTRLTMGNALAASLLKSCVDAGVEMWSNAPMHELLTETESDAVAVKGVTVQRDGAQLEVVARHGVILASGGFSANPEMRKRYIPFADQHVSIVPEGNTGDGITRSLELGADFDGENLSNAGWVVVSVHREPSGNLRKFPHLFLDRGKPGCITINKAGERFGNESVTNFVDAMHRSGSVPAYLICDHRFIKKYGLGLVRPGGIGLKKMTEEGYLQTADTLAQLAEAISVNSEGLVQTVTRFNHFAEQGHDEDFQRGDNPSDFGFGDLAHGPNPCLGKILQPPFYAVKVFPGDSTTTVGLRVDAEARVLAKGDRPISGLYAVGLDMNSLWRGRAPGNGANNTLGMTFGYIAARSAAAQKT